MLWNPLLQDVVSFRHFEGEGVWGKPFTYVCMEV